MPLVGHAQIHPDTNILEGQLSAAAKFCDVYSADPAKESSFSIGSSATNEIKRHGIEEIRFICLDGFVKTIQINDISERKIKKIVPTGKTQESLLTLTAQLRPRNYFIAPYGPLPT